MSERDYKFLVMQIDSKKEAGGAMFLNANLGGGGRCTSATETVTHFRQQDREGCHDNDDYWNSAEELLVGFSRWYNRVDEKTSYNMGNRLYSATHTYRFFRVEDELLSREDLLGEANKDLTPYEITEREFISNMIGSWAFQQMSHMFSETFFTLNRVAAQPVKVDIVINKEFNTWCWISDYLEKDKECLETCNAEVPIGYDYKQGIAYITKLAKCEYRFGGNDAYNKRKALEEK